MLLAIVEMINVGTDNGIIGIRGFVKIKMFMRNITDRSVLTDSALIKILPGKAEDSIKA